jgi:hypothetical protein
MELLSFEAQYNGYTTFGHLPTGIETCVTSLNASVAHRLKAAAMLMIRSDNEFDAEAASRVYDAVKHLKPGSRRERIAWLTIQAVYHTSFGELEQAPHILRQLASEALSIAHPASRVFHVRRASFGLARYDDPAYARGLLVQCLETFERLDLRTQALFCIEELGTLALWRGDGVEALNWAERIRSEESYADASFARAIEYELRMLVAFEAENSALMPGFQLSSEFTAALSMSKRGRLALLTLGVAEQVLRQDLPAVERSLQPLLALFLETKTRGNQDHAAAVIAEAMMSLGQRQQAASLMTDYMLNSRRELRVPSRHLQTVFERCSPIQDQLSMVSTAERDPAAQ